MPSSFGYAWDWGWCDRLGDRTQRCVLSGRQHYIGHCQQCDAYAWCSKSHQSWRRQPIVAVRRRMGHDRQFHLQQLALGCGRKVRRNVGFTGMVATRFSSYDWCASAMWGARLHLR
eukprot:COSAG02_NODE_8365_length_2597_cov_1.100480_3_plen_116_part_00